MVFKNPIPKGVFHIADLRRKWTDELLTEKAQSLYEWTCKLAEKGELGMLGDWAFQNNFPPKDIWHHASRHVEFGYAYEWAKAYQEHAISKGALTKQLDARFAIFMLGCVHGWKTSAMDDEGKLVNDFAQFIEYMKMQDAKKDEKPAC
jgi:hypothetical protein